MLYINVWTELNTMYGLDMNWYDICIMGMDLNIAINAGHLTIKSVTNLTLRVSTLHNI